MRVLVVEDSSSLRHALHVGLERSGFAVDSVEDGEQALRFIGCSVYDVIILDLLLPKRDGLFVLRQMRAQGDNTHVLILSARDQTTDRITGLELGADDYLVKPFAFEELKARIQALIRRRFDDKRPSLSVGPLMLNPAAREVRRGEDLVPLSPKEFAVLEALCRHQGSVLSRAQLIERTTGFEREITENAVDVLICALRRKLKAFAADQLIRTKRGFGYYVQS